MYYVIERFFCSCGSLTPDNNIYSVKRVVTFNRKIEIDRKYRSLDAKQTVSITILSKLLNLSKPQTISIQFKPGVIWKHSYNYLYSETLILCL